MQTLYLTYFPVKLYIYIYSNLSQVSIPSNHVSNAFTLFSLWRFSQTLFYLVGLIKVDLQYGGNSYFARNTNVTLAIQIFSWLIKFNLLL